MNTLVIVLTLLSVMFTTAGGVAAERKNDPVSVGTGNHSHRSLSVIQLDVRAALRAEASTRRLGPNVPEVIRLIDLYRELADHPKRDTSDFLTRLALRVRTRLDIVRDHIERQKSPQTRHAKKRTAQSIPAAPVSHVFAQQIGIPGGLAAGQGAQPAAAPPGGEAIVDYGPELVDLIHRTISPARWDINGGLSSMVYFAPRRALVVSAPGTVHDQIDDVLGQLRAAP